MSKGFKGWFWAIIIYCLILMAINIKGTVEIHHLNSENAKFKHEIEYLKGSNELLREDNQEFQDALWHYYDVKMKEGDLGE